MNPKRERHPALREIPLLLNDADPGFLEVEDAKERLAGLKSQ